MQWVRECGEVREPRAQDLTVLCVTCGVTARDGTEQTQGQVSGVLTGSGVENGLQGAGVEAGRLLRGTGIF